MARASYQPTTGYAELAGERRQRGYRAQPRAAVLVALESISPGNDRGRSFLVPASQSPDAPGIDTADLRGALGRILPGCLHVRLESNHMLRDERWIEATRLLELDRE